MTFFLLDCRVLLCSAICIFSAAFDIFFLLLFMGCAVAMAVQGWQDWGAPAAAKAEASLFSSLG